MNDFELDGMVAATATVSDAEVDALALARLADLCQVIMSTAAEPVLEPAKQLTRGHRRAGHRRRVGALATGVALIVIVLLVLQGRSAKDGSAWAARAVKVAEAAPRVLVTGGGWGVTDVPGFDGDNGEVTFRHGQATVELFWRPVSTHDDFVKDRAHGGVSLGTMQVAGHDAQVFAERAQAGAPTGLFNVLWKSGDHSVELMVSGVNRQALEGSLKRVREVDVDTWLSAMPPSVVRPIDRAATVDGMLAGIPVPRGFNVDGLRSVDNPGLDRGHLGFFVTRAVGCSWLEQWVAATNAGDHVAAAAAVEAMRSSRAWPILHEMNAEGGWLRSRVQQIWEFADALERGFAFDGTGRERSVRDYYAPEFCLRPL
jgi:hypothetical protein